MLDRVQNVWGKREWVEAKKCSKKMKNSVDTAPTLCHSERAHGNTYYKNMRTKTLLGLTALAVSALTAVGAEVYSLNVVGYVNVQIDAGTPASPSFKLIGNPLSASPNNTVASVFGTQVPAGASLYTWTGVDFSENGSYGGGTWDDDTVDVSPGVGFFVKNTGAAFPITFVGEVLSGPRTNVMDKFFNLVSAKVPLAGDLQTNPNLNLTNAVAGDSLLKWTGFDYAENGYYGGGTWDDTPSVVVPEGFFYKENPAGTVHTVNWVTIGVP
jgi:hypothetical protein